MNDQFLDQGFIFLKQALSPRLLEKTYLESLRVAKEMKLVELKTAETPILTGEGLKITNETVNQFAKKLIKTESYLKLYNSKAIKDLVKELTGKDTVSPVRRGHPTWARIGVPKVNGLPPHQDIWYIRSRQRFFTLWIPLTDCPEKLGSLAVLPGSHKEGIYVHEPKVGVPIPYSKKTWWSGSFKAGDVLVFDGQTLHSPLPNRTKKTPRFSVDFRFYA